MSLPYSAWRPVYPRVCGGTHKVVGAQPCHQGLSPRVRGNLDHLRVGGGCQGSIPACAGEPSYDL